MKEDKEILNMLKDIEKDLNTISDDVKILEDIAKLNNSAMFIIADNSNYVNASDTSVSLDISILAILAGIFIILYEITANKFFLVYLMGVIVLAFFIYTRHFNTLKRLSNNLKESVRQAEQMLKKYKNEP